MNQEQNQAMNMLQCDVQGLNIASAGVQTAVYTTTGSSINTFYGDPNASLWNYWQNQYYPYVIRESYPVYIQDKAMDKGKHAFELLKALMDKGLVKVDKVKDFIEAMDTILKTL